MHVLKFKRAEKRKFDVTDVPIRQTYSVIKTICRSEGNLPESISL
jgi:hypothetical protein